MATFCRGRVRDRSASVDRARVRPSRPSRPRPMPRTWLGITGCAAWMCASAVLGRVASRQCALWPLRESKYVRFATSRRFRTTDAVRPSDAACKLPAFGRRFKVAEFQGFKDLETFETLKH